MKFEILLLTLFIFLFNLEHCLLDIMCRNEQNRNVDWFVMIKYPNTFQYVYIASDSVDFKWQLSDYSMEDDRNIVGVTLRQIYNRVKDESFYAFYNDAKPNSDSSTSGGHLKGIINTDQTSGYWLIHSIPQFPLEKSYFFNKSQSIYAQSFMCLSIDAKQLPTIIQQLLVMTPTVYSYDIPQYLKKNATNIDFINKFIGNYRKNLVPSSILNLTTASFKNMVHFAKSGLFKQDLYAGLIAPSLKDSLYVETWTKGMGGKLDSHCEKNYRIYNINEVNLLNRTFKSTQDHSKWAVSYTSRKPFVCIGDINRMKSQFKRGGGSLCFINEDIWKAFHDLIKKYEEC